MHAQHTIVSRFLKEDQGATMVEYALLISLIALIAFAGVVAFGNSMQTLYQNIRDQIAAALA
ncbi:Flp family type IVb pilin [Trinickia mobilis]|uniref:Flp family type IVb pilin n=1 Tax=Trinickia mobilis TaxID=2816356 RepID=UPI001A8FE5AF|nr:Flp family type IVb pilin [Trinickia mobilis]